MQPILGRFWTPTLSHAKPMLGQLHCGSAITPSRPAAPAAPSRLQTLTVVVPAAAAATSSSSAAAAAAATATAAATAKSASRPAVRGPIPGRVMFVGGLPGQLAADVLHQQLEEACRPCQPTFIEVVQFQSEEEKSRFQAGWKHKGFALVAFTSEDAVADASAAVSRIKGWGATAVVGPARKVPQHWPQDLTLTGDEVAQLRQQQQQLEARKKHNQRQQQRQKQRLVDSVNLLLTSLPPPAGKAVLQQYKQLLVLPSWQIPIQQEEHLDIRRQVSGSSTSGSDGCGQPASNAADLAAVLLQAMHAPLRTIIRPHVFSQLVQQQQQQQQQQQHQQQQQMQSFRPIQPYLNPCVTQAEASLLFDWAAAMPAALDPAFGGQLADADVVRAGQGRMNLRAIRKRVQVEGFALLLWQLTQPAVARQQHLQVVEFGCGSGNLVLPLAYLFPSFTFTAVDIKSSAVRLLLQRVQQAQLKNVVAVQQRIENYEGPADVILALHACGAASDYSLQQAAARKAAYIVSPCCIGKVKRAINKSRSLGDDSSNKTSNSSSSSSSNINSNSNSGRGTSLVAGVDNPASPVAVAVDGITAAFKHAQQDALQGVNAGADDDDVNHLQLQYPRSAWLTEQLSLLAARVTLREQQQAGKQAMTDTAATAAAVPAPVAARNSLYQALQGATTPAEQSMGLFAVLAQAADYSHVQDHGYPELAAVAKSVVEFDRQLGMVESGYRASLVRLLQPELTSKSDVLVGAPQCFLLESQQLLSSASWHGDAAGCSSSGRHGDDDDDDDDDDGSNGRLFGRFAWPWAV